MSLQIQTNNDINYFELCLDNVIDDILKECPFHSNKILDVEEIDDSDGEYDIDIKSPNVILYVKKCLREFCERYFQRSPEAFMLAREKDLNLEMRNHKYLTATYEMFDDIYRYHYYTNDEFKRLGYEYRFNFVDKLNEHTDPVFFNNCRIILNDVCINLYGTNFISFMDI